MSIKEQITEQAGKLFMRYGIRSVSMDDIASKLGMSKKTIYQYFENKSDLIQQVTLSHIQQDLAVFNSIRDSADNAVEELMNFAQYLMETIRQVSPTAMYDLQKYYRESFCKVQEVHRQYVYSTIKENIERGQQQDIYRAEINADIAARMYVAASHAVMDEDVFPMENYKKEEIIKEFIHQFVHGWASDKGLELWKAYIARSEQQGSHQSEQASY
ncbi:MAG: TetR/AcrR family transcriptional regulator [Bacteroidota bacterium]